MAGRGQKVVIFGLAETSLAQAAIASEDSAALSANRLRADSREFVAPIRLIEGTAGDPQAAKALKALKQLALVGDGANHKVRMRDFNGKKRSCHFNGCVAGLDDLLRNREIVPHEEIDIRRVVLCELHSSLLSKNKPQPILAPKHGESKALRREDDERRRK
jgi:hypothetical protein